MKVGNVPRELISVIDLNNHRILRGYIMHGGMHVADLTTAHATMHSL